MVGTQNWVTWLGVNRWAIAFSILGAFGILSLASDIIEFEKHIGTVVAYWQTMTRAMMDFLFGWIFRLLGIEFPWWAKDYFTMCFVAAGMLARTYIKVNGNLKDAWDGFREKTGRNAVFIVVWPWPFLIGLKKIFIDKTEADRKGFLIYFETVVWAVAVIAVNYLLVWVGAPVA